MVLSVKTKDGDKCSLEFDINELLVLCNNLDLNELVKSFKDGDNNDPDEEDQEEELVEVVIYDSTYCDKLGRAITWLKEHKRPYTRSDRSVGSGEKVNAVLTEEELFELRNYIYKNEEDGRPIIL